jgi:putative serine protease PepD
MERTRDVVIALLVALVIGAVAIVGVNRFTGDGGGDAQTSAEPASTATSRNSATAASSPVDSEGSDDIDPGASLAVAYDFSALYERVRPSVVRLTTGESPDPFTPLQEGLGSGIVIDTDGNILTNNHVVRGAGTVTVTFADGTTATAEVIGRDPGNDVALIRADVDDPSVLVPATLGDSDDVKIGSAVAALGSPFGLDGTFTTGIISGLDRTLSSSANGRPLRGLLQTDSAVNPGNSGGALFNVYGEVIGINTAIENPNGTGFVGIAYAVPINTPKRYMEQLVSGETIEHPRLGISGRSLTPDEANRLGVEHGVAVISVSSGSGADEAGLRESQTGSGDIIVAIDGRPMRTFEDLADYIESRSVGDDVVLTVYREGEEIELPATLLAWDSTA